RFLISQEPCPALQEPASIPRAEVQLGIVTGTSAQSFRSLNRSTHCNNPSVVVRRPANSSKEPFKVLAHNSSHDARSVSTVTTFCRRKLLARHGSVGSRKGRLLLSIVAIRRPANGPANTSYTSSS